MAKRRRTTAAASKPTGRKPRPDIVHTSVYLPQPIHERLREIAFLERCKIHDLILEGVELAIKKRGSFRSAAR